MAKELPAQADKLSQVSVVDRPRQVGEGDRLYGSVTTRDIAEALQGAGRERRRKKMQLAEPIKALGMTEVPDQARARTSRPRSRSGSSRRSS